MTLLASPLSEVRRSAALMALEVGEYAEALDLLDAALADDGEDRVSRFYRGVTLSRLGRYPEAQRALEGAGSDNPAQPRELGLVLLKQGHTEAAITQLRSAVQRDPADAANHYQLALALRHAGQRRAALAALADARSQSDEYAPPALYQGAELYAELGERDAALALLEQGLRDYPESVYQGAMRDLQVRLGGGERPRAPHYALSLGLAQDSNVALLANDAPLPNGISDQADRRVVLEGEIVHTALDTPERRLTLDYRLYASAQQTLNDYDLVRHTLGAELMQPLRVGRLSGGWGLGLHLTHTSLGGSAFSQEQSLTPFLFAAHNTTTRSLLRLDLGGSRYADDAYAPLDQRRIALEYSLLGQLSHRGHWTLGTRLVREQADDAEYSNQGHGLAAQLQQQFRLAEVGLALDYQFRDYADGVQGRQDEQIITSLRLRRALRHDLTLQADLSHVAHPSNLAAYEYDRDLVKLSLRWQP